ncbi:MAG: hypothetical protein DWQ01_05300 [Planctomycetota bacterium]|nr:MAG: hypothetical protein DWQ01_05300 [Planctomycetota bacterium]
MPPLSFCGILLSWLGCHLNPSFLQPQEDSWPTYQHDLCRSGVTPNPLPENLELSWVHHPSAAPSPSWPAPADRSFWQRLETVKPRVVYDRTFHPVCDRHRVYYGSSSDDQIHALSLDTGQRVWSFATGGPIRFAPHLIQGRLYAVSDDGFLYCLQAEHGTLINRWRLAPEPDMVIGHGRLISAWPPRTGVAVQEERVLATIGLFPSQGTYAMALNSKQGRIGWQKRLDDLSPQGYLLASKQILYVPTGRTQPFALAVEDGEFLGRFGSPGGSYALLEESFLATGPGNTGQLELSSPISRERLASFPANRMVARGNDAYFQSDRTLTALDRERHQKLTAKLERLDQRRRELRAALDNPKLSLEQKAEKEAAWTRLEAAVEVTQKKLESCLLWHQPSTYSDALILAGNRLYAGGSQGVAAFDAESGAQVWQSATPGTVYGLAAAPHHLLVANERGQILAYGNPSQGPASPTNKPEHPSSIRRPPPPIQEHPLWAWLEQNMANQRGWALILDCEDTDILQVMAEHCRLRLIATHSDPKQVDRLRKELAEASLLGVRAQAYLWNPDHQGLPQQAFRLVFSAKLFFNRKQAELPAEILNWVRPFGGFLLQSPTVNAEAWLQRSSVQDAEVQAKLDFASTIQRGKPAGTGAWTHIYADASNRSCSDDQTVGGSLTLQWFGGPGPSQMVDRHLRTFPPLAAEGRLFIPGQERIVAVDAYTGLELWQREFSGFSRTGIPYDSGAYCLSPTALFVAQHRSCLALDLDDGSLRKEFFLPVSQKESESAEWGWVAFQSGRLFGSLQPQGAARRKQSRQEIVDQYSTRRPLVCGNQLFAMDPDSGDLLWQRQFHPFLNSSLSLSENRIFLVACRSAPELESNGRLSLNHLWQTGADLIALDASHGEVLWSRNLPPLPLEHSLFMSFHQDKLFIVGAYDQGRTTRYGAYAFDSQSGRLLWQQHFSNNRSGIGGDHGEQVHHPVLRGDWLLAEPLAFQTATGEQAFPGGRENWSIPSRGGCGTLAASQKALFFRDGNPTYMDLESGAAPAPVNQVSRPGCWINLLPACGLLLIPEASSGCVCSFPLQTSMAFRAESGT